MSKRDSTLTQERLKQLLHYDPETGIFTRLINSGHTKKGDIAGDKTLINRIQISVDGIRYRAHRLAWLYVYGYWPICDTDHIDGNPNNNSIKNLRDISHAVNLQNRHAHQKNNASGFLGVYFCKRSSKWISEITTFGKRKYIGSFFTPEKAHEAYLKYKRELHEGCTI